DRAGAIQLFHDDDARQLVRQRERPQAPHRPGSLAHGGCDAHGAANDQGAIPAIEAPRVKLPGKLFAGPPFAVHIEQYDLRRARNCLQEVLAFHLALQPFACGTTRFSHLAFVEGREPGESPKIVVTYRSQRRSQLADGDQRPLHQAYSPRMRCIAATRSIASMYAPMRMLTLCFSDISDTSSNERIMIFCRRSLTVS